MTERRIARRYELVIPVLVGRAGVPNAAAFSSPRGVTRDISTSGLYFTTSKPPSPGACVELTFTLPRNLTGSNDVLVEVVGRVVRVDSRQDSGAASNVQVSPETGVAAHIEKYDIISTRAAMNARSVVE
ncbi:MAG: hypothetical protein GZ088_09285 [Acidipila sp.]|nr:hypothetical protein [Acidipila sp.]